MHTPGPLFVDGDSESVMHFHVRQGKEAGFHQVAMYCSEADAHLYASAPDLLEACKEALRYEDWMDEKTIEMLDKAVQKAENFNKKERIPETL
jgi:hypothetical protein